MTSHDGAPGGVPTTCPGCGLISSQVPGPVPTELLASPGCWEQYGRASARSFVDPAYRSVHQILVDAYAGQHAGGTSRRQVQLVALCLMTLCLVVENGADPADGPALHQRMMRRRLDFVWLAPPPRSGPLTVADVLTADGRDEYCRLVRRWGQQVWYSWAPHHATIRAWNACALD